MGTPKIYIQSSWKDQQNSKSEICEYLGRMQVTASSLNLSSLWLISCLESPILRISPFYALLESDHITCQGISAPLTLSLLSHHKAYAPCTTAPLKATNRSLQAMYRDWLKVSYLCVFWARNGLKPSGQQQKQRSWTSFHANDLSVASCWFTVLLSARAPGPSKPGARF